MRRAWGYLTHIERTNQLVREAINVSIRSSILNSLLFG